MNVCFLASSVIDEVWVVVYNNMYLFRITRVGNNIVCVNKMVFTTLKLPTLIPPPLSS